MLNKSENIGKDNILSFKDNTKVVKVLIIRVENTYIVFIKLETIKKANAMRRYYLNSRFTSSLFFLIFILRALRKA